MKYAHGFCFTVLCCGYTLTDFPISIRLTSLALWQSKDCPSASKATLMNMDKYFMWIHYERLHNHNKAKHNKTVCIFLGIYCTPRNIAAGGINRVWPRHASDNSVIIDLHYRMPRTRCLTFVYLIFTYNGYISTIYLFWWIGWLLSRCLSVAHHWIHQQIMHRLWFIYKKSSIFPKWYIRAMQLQRYTEDSFSVCLEASPQYQIKPYKLFMT